MKIPYTCNLEENADYGEKNLYWGLANAKNLKTKNVLESTLKKYYKNENISDSLKEFLKDFQQNCENFQICYLNLNGTLPRTTIKKMLENNGESEKDFKNIVIIGQSNSFEKWKNYNSAAIFCKLKIINKLTKIITNTNDINTQRSDISFYFEIKRIEFLDLPYLDKSKNIKNFVDLYSVDFEEYARDKKSSQYDGKNSTDISILQKINHCVDIFNDDTELKEDVNELNKWKHIIKNLFDLVENESNLVNYLFSFDEYNLSNLLNNDFYLISKQSKLNSENLKNFTFSQDDSISLKVKTKIKSSENEDDNFLKEIENRIKKNEKEINEIQKDISSFFEKVANLENELKEKIKIISERENEKLKKEKDLEKLNNEIAIYETEIKNIDDEIKSFESQIKNNNDKDLSRIKKYEKEIVRLNIQKKDYKFKKNNTNKKIELLNKEINQIDEEISNMKKEENSINYDIYISKNSIEKCKKNKKIYEVTNDNLNILYESFTEKELHIFKITLSLNEEKEIDNFNFSQKPFFDLYKADQNLSTISEDINGFRQKIKRYNYAIKHAIEGNYRNPFLLYSINETPEIINLKEIPTEIKNKYNLNEKQLSAVNKAISSRDTFYLQGPPGTGKTQVITAITDILTSQHKNVLMTSSTHEAIHNFFDRLDYLSSKNPNIILLKNSNTDKELKYSEANLYKNFIEKIKNYIIGEKDQNNDLIEKINEIRNNLANEEIWNFRYFNDIFISELLSKPKDELNEFENKILLKISKDEFTDIEDIDKKLIISWIDRKFREYTQNLEKNKKEKIKEIYEQDYQLNKLPRSLNEIYSSIKAINQSKTTEKIKEYFSNRNDEKIRGYPKEFNKYIFENEMINVIGLTTTAKTEIQINSDKKNLFFEYPIDTVIIDEISKSATPEILARVVLAKKVIFAGDYMQLPPSSDIDRSTVQKIVNDNQLCNEISKIFNCKFEQEITKEKKEFILENEFEKLFKNSFFRNQVKKIKKKNDEGTKSYEFLNIQHRFTEKIMDLVNINYDNNEKLEMPKNYKEFEKFDFNWNNTNYKNYDVISIDTSILEEKYKKQFENKGIRLNKNSFDQSVSIIYENFSEKSTGKFNEYNAEIVLKVCNNFFEKHSTKLINKIGIICLTNNQKNLIKYIINKNAKFSQLKELKIKIDTIDNFQGREKEIIIVDFVRAWGNLEKDKKLVNYASDRNLNFVSSIERNNVALSRAKNKIILIGSFNYYINSNSKHEYEIKNLAKKYIEKGTYIKQGE